VTKAMVEQLGGVLVVHSGATRGQVFVSVLAYQPGRLSSNDELRRVLSSIIDDFSLTASIGWPTNEPAGLAR
jgi:hypothetical protein